MSTLAWFATASLATWLWLLLGQGFFWRTDQRLPPVGEDGAAGAGGGWPRVVVVVPARDEAEVLPLSLPSLLAQDYPGEAEVILVDDGSTDGTGRVAAELAERYGATGERYGVTGERYGAAGERYGVTGERYGAAGERRGLPLTVVSPGEPEPGWTGKLWALRHGMALARARDPEFLLLTDADIAHGPDSLRLLVAAARANDLDLVSQMARLRVASPWERLVVPAFVYFFAQLYPFRWINGARPRATAAAGGCVLLRTETAVAAGVPEAIRRAVIDDVSLARAVRRSGGRIWLGLAERVDSIRPYPGLGELWRMVSRSAYAQLRNNPLLLTGTVAGLVVIYLVPPVALVAGALTGDPASAWAGGAAWAVMAGTYLPMLRYYRQPLWLAALLPFTALLYLLMTVDSAVQHYRGRGAAWKGRTYAGSYVSRQGD
ncbi:glycosyltransferase [Streptomyces narbonensis]|uniref:glycosyltransferase n=1 Tax=Streptomyces narbonensis TaxID=67333 RepID=UPI001674B8B1|nr:glycosyltransferase [Streptomyces narbonensis]GGW03421.1 glycosyl transferase family 2 [Streptomyces narbonensis]